MGKKRKQAGTGELSISEKRVETSQPGPQPQPQLESKPQPLPVIRYADMPENHKRKLYICDDCGSAKKYLETICWMREMGCAHGSVFSDIRNLQWDGTGYPLIEIEVIAPDNRSSKFLILKKTLYLIAFLVLRSGWFQFDTEFDIAEAETLAKGYDEKYKHTPWREVGPKAMIEAIHTLALEVFDATNPLPHTNAAEVFFVHLCEAARLYPMETYVYRSLLHSEPGTYPITTSHPAEASIILGKGKGIVSELEDVYSSVKVDGLVNTGLNLQTPEYFESLLKKFANLCKFWYGYSLSGGHTDIRASDLQKFRLRSMKSLKSTLAVLCWTNLYKVLMEWQGRVGKSITAAEYKSMADLLSKLNEEKKIFFQVN